MTDITEEMKLGLQMRAQIPHIPTDLTYECRMAIEGDGPRSGDWADKPHRLVFDLCREIEHLRLSLSEARATGRREGLSEAANIADEHAEYIEGVGKKNPEDSPSRDRCFARAKSCLAIAAAIRAAMEKAE